MDFELQFDAERRIILIAFHNDLTEASYLAGFAAALAFLKANPEIANRIEKAIRENSGIIAERILDNADPAEQDDAADA